MKALSERDHEIRQLTNDISAATLKLDREKTTTEVEVRENNVLRDRVVNLTNDLEDTKASRAETIKIVESLKIDQIAQKQILESQSAMEEMDARYRDVAAALSITQNRRAQQVPSSTPDIHPEMESPDDSARAQISDDYGTRDQDIIEDHIMDYKLGLRKSMIPTELQSKLDDLTPKQDGVSTPETPRSSTQ